MTGACAFLAWLAALLCLVAIHQVSAKVDRLERELHRPACTWGASSVGPVTIRGGRVTGNTTPTRTGCTP